jgi:hypothetical protein
VEEDATFLGRQSFLEFSDSAMDGLWDNFRLGRLSSTVREWRK